MIEGENQTAATAEQWGRGNGWAWTLSVPAQSISHTGAIRKPLWSTPSLASRQFSTVWLLTCSFSGVCPSCVVGRDPQGPVAAASGMAGLWHREPSTAYGFCMWAAESLASFGQKFVRHIEALVDMFALFNPYVWPLNNSEDVILNRLQRKVMEVHLLKQGLV